MKNKNLIFIILGIVIIIFVLRKYINHLFMFDLIMNAVLKHEGGYVNDPDDKGGETKYGITKYRYPDLDIKNLTRSQAIAIYKRDFYVPMEISKIEDINLALQYIDTAVNALTVQQGIDRAKRFMQQALEIKKTSNKSLVEIYKDIRKNFYRSLVTKNPVYEKFINGWLKRVDTKIA